MRGSDELYRLANERIAQLEQLVREKDDTIDDLTLKLKEVTSDKHMFKAAYNKQRKEKRRAYDRHRNNGSK